MSPKLLQPCSRATLATHARTQAGGEVGPVGGAVDVEVAAETGLTVLVRAKTKIELKAEYFIMN